MAKRKSKYETVKGLLKNILIDKTPLTGVTVRIDTTPEELHGEKTIYRRLHNWLWPREDLVGNIFDFISRVAYANEAVEWVEIGRTEEEVIFLRLKFYQDWTAGSLLLGLLNQARLYVDNINDEGGNVHYFEIAEDLNGGRW